MLNAVNCIAVLSTLLASNIATPAPFPTPIAGPRILQPQSELIRMGTLSTPIDGLSLALAPHRTPYSHRHYVYIVLHFVNTTRHFYNYDPRNIRWTVTGPDVVHHALGRGDDLFVVHGIDPIRPGKWENEYNLGDFVTFRAPGTYTVQANVHVIDLGVDVTSPPVTIDVK